MKGNIGEEKSDGRRRGNKKSKKLVLQGKFQDREIGGGKEGSVRKRNPSLKAVEEEGQQRERR